MPSLVHVAVHPSQFPETVRRELLDSLRARQVNHKFLYESLKQTQKWLALHEACSPSRTDADCDATYDRAFAAVAAGIGARQIHLAGLGCGGGRKDARLLQLLRDSGKEVFYTPADVSAALVLTAGRTATTVIPQDHCFPLVVDLSTADDLPGVLDQLFASGQQERALLPSPARVLTFLGMIPNFEPQTILPRLAALVRPADGLLVSANLAPGADYDAGIQRILPLYDNELTRDWLLTFLLDLGLEKDDGQLRFLIEEVPAGSGLKRVAAYFHFCRPCEIRVDAHSFQFSAGESFRLFFSYRHTPEQMRTLLGQHGLEVAEHWRTRSEEEGVFLVTGRAPELAVHTD